MESTLGTYGFIWLEKCGLTSKVLHFRGIRLKKHSIKFIAKKLIRNLLAESNIPSVFVLPILVYIIIAIAANNKLDIGPASATNIL